MRQRGHTAATLEGGIASARVRVFPCATVLRHLCRALRTHSMELCMASHPAGHLSGLPVTRKSFQLPGVAMHTQLALRIHRMRV